MGLRGGCTTLPQIVWSRVGAASGGHRQTLGLLLWSRWLLPISEWGGEPRINSFRHRTSSLCGWGWVYRYRFEIPCFQIRAARTAHALALLSRYPGPSLSWSGTNQSSLKPRHPAQVEDRTQITCTRVHS